MIDVLALKHLSFLELDYSYNYLKECQVFFYFFEPKSSVCFKSMFFASLFTGSLYYPK